MRSFRAWSSLFLVPALAALLTLGGCNKKKGNEKAEQQSSTEGAGKSDSGEEKKEANAEKEKAGAEEKKEETPAGEGGVVKGTGKATLAGAVTFEGAVPDRPVIVKPNGTNHDYCMKGDALDQTWIVDKKTKAIANVLVFITPPKEKKFEPVTKKWYPEVVKVDQPYCAFEPHVSVVRPGQKVEILNSATISHNTNYKGSPTKNPGSNETLAPGKDILLKTLKPDVKPVRLSCNIHTWMNGYIWVLDTPYAAVTDKDGKFKIENIPAGVPLEVYYWHESFGDSLKNAKKVGEITFKEGDNTKNLTVSKK